MNLMIGSDYQSMSEQSAKDLLDIISPLKNPVLCTASGDSPKGMYKELIRLIHESDIDISNWHFIGLDEWAGMNDDDEGSCRFHLNNDLFNPLHIKGNKIAFFDGKAIHPVEECNRIENIIKENGGIDVAIVGLGLNGHIGMNEPGTPANSRSHVAEIASSTQQAGQKYFKESRQLTNGLTLGIADLMDARHVMLLVSGTKKAHVVKEVLEGNISVQLPASLLRNHKNVSIFLDADAASLLQKDT